MIELIIDGIYGCRDISTNQIVPKMISDGPFETLKELEEDAVKRGIARYVIEENYQENIAMQNSLDDTSDNEMLGDKGNIRPDYNADMKVTDLKVLAENVGIDASKCIKRTDVIALLDKYYDGLENEEIISDEENEDIIPASEDTAPVFDALESVK